MPELQDQTHAAHLWPIAQHGDLAPDLGAFLASVAIHSCTPIKRSHKSKTVGCVCVCVYCKMETLHFGRSCSGTEHGCYWLCSYAILYTFQLLTYCLRNYMYLMFPLSLCYKIQACRWVCSSLALQFRYVNIEN